jgi:hypothetical protein
MGVDDGNDQYPSGKNAVFEIVASRAVRRGNHYIKSGKPYAKLIPLHAGKKNAGDWKKAGLRMFFSTRSLKRSWAAGNNAGAA